MFSSKRTTVFTVFAVISFALTVSVIADDTEGLRHALKTLCDVNKQGPFAKCCKDHPAASVVIDDKSTWSCYLGDITVQDSSIVFLDFNYKGVNDIGIGAFASLTNLASLEMAFNKIPSIKKGAFDGLTNLLSLDLMLNSLEELEAGVFDVLENLEVIHLYTNCLRALPSGIFDHFSKMLALDLDYNSITSLPDGLFDHMTMLDGMDISANPYNTLPPRAFASLTLMTVLLTHDNGYTQLPYDAFPKDSHLILLDIHSNKLTSLPDNTFSNLKDLQVLTMGGNGMSSISSELFAKTPKLTDIDLNDNGLTALPDDFFDGLSQLQYLNLDRNSLTFIDLGNATPSSFFVTGNSIVSYHQEDDIVSNGTTQMAFEASENCLLAAQIPTYRSPRVHIVADDENRCPKDICKEELRLQGCYKCNGDVCTSCINGYILYNGTCVVCDATDDCPFNNKNEIYCVSKADLSHCPIPEPAGCADHTCVDATCFSGEYSETKQCDIGGLGCKGCRCMTGWYPKKDKDCQNICGDGFVVGPEQCDGTEGCNNQTCKCAEGYTFVQHGPRKKCVLKTSVADLRDAKKILHDFQARRKYRKPAN